MSLTDYYVFISIPKIHIFKYCQQDDLCNRLLEKNYFVNSLLDGQFSMHI